MAEYGSPNVCNCFASPCPIPTQQRQVRTLLYDATPIGGNSPYVNQSDLDDALTELRALPWRDAGGTAISYCYTVVSRIYMSESRARWVVPEQHYGDTNAQNYARYQIGTYYNGGSGTIYTKIDDSQITWNGPGSTSDDSRATSWEPLLIDDWAVEAGQQDLDHRGFISSLNYTCYDTEILPPLP